jgi:hypothetical protein
MRQSRQIEPAVLRRDRLKQETLMKHIKSFLVGLSLAIPALATTPTTLPANSGRALVGSPPADSPPANSSPANLPPAGSSDGSVDPLLGKPFRSRLEGIQFNPPAGGTMMRELNSGEVVRFVYPSENWDIHVKPITSHVPLRLSNKLADDGVLQMVVNQLKNNNAQIITQDVRRLTAGGKDIGLIEARYEAGINVIFTQVAIVEDDAQRFFEVQMNSPGKPKTAPAAAEDPNETDARKMFQHMIATVAVLDRQSLGKEQQHRVYATDLLWVQLDRRRITSAIVPQHFMRVVQNGKDIGFIQVDERLATHSGHEGIEYIVHSRVKTGAEQITDAARSQPLVNEGNTIPNGLVSSPGAAPSSANSGVANSGAVNSGAPTNLYTNSTYFVTFDRAHEDWNTITQVDQQSSSQLTEMGNSDRVDRIRLDFAALAAEQKSGNRPKDRQPPTTQVSDYALKVDQYAHGGHLGKPVKTELYPFYLPQAMGQMLARLLPIDPEKYLFSFYVSNQKNVMARYVDVGKAVDITLDGQQYHAIPIADRIGVDGIPTVHYVTKDGQWLGSVNEDSKLLVLPCDAGTLEAIWKSDPKGFAICPVPPLPEELPVVKKPTTPLGKTDSEGQR